MASIDPLDGVAGELAALLDGCLAGADHGDGVAAHGHDPALIAEFLERMRDSATPFLLEGTDAQSLELKVIAR